MLKTKQLLNHIKNEKQIDILYQVFPEITELNPEYNGIYQFDIFKATNRNSICLYIFVGEKNNYLYFVTLRENHPSERKYCNYCYYSVNREPLKLLENPIKNGLILTSKTHSIIIQYSKFIRCKELLLFKGFYKISKKLNKLSIGIFKNDDWK